MKELRKNSIAAIAILMAINLSACGGESDSNSGDRNNQQHNSPPVASIASISSIDERSTLDLDGRPSSDTDGTITSYKWSVEVDQDVSVNLVNPTERSTQLVIGEVIEETELTIKLEVTDNDGATSESETVVLVNEIDFNLLPPDPGAASLDSLEGIDSDNDGVRDDVEIAIYELHKDSQENREILKVGSKALQEAIMSAVSAGDQDNDSASESMAKFAYCLSELSSMDRNKQLATLKSLQINTDERKAAYDAYNKSRHGTIQRVVEATLEECMAIDNQGGN